MKLRRLFLLLPFSIMVIPTLQSCKDNTTLINNENVYISSTLFLEIFEWLENIYYPSPIFPNEASPNLTQEQKEENLKKLHNYLNEEYFKGDLIKIENKDKINKIDLIFNKTIELENFGFGKIYNGGWEYIQVCYLKCDKKVLRFNKLYMW